MKNQNEGVRILIGVSLVLLVATYTFSVVEGIQMPINVVSAVWVTSESTSTTDASRVWMEIDAAPGDRNMRLRVTIQNLSNATISGISADLKLQYPFKNVTEGDISRAYYSGSISPGANAAADFLLNINLGASKGEYKLTMVLYYLETASGVGKTLYFQKSTEVVVPVIVTLTRYMVIYSVIVSPSTTVPAGNITISGNLLNIGKISAYNTNVTISSPVLVRSTSIIVGQVDPNVPRPFSSGMQLRRDITPGTYSVTISVTYVDSMVVNHISQSDLRLVVRQPEQRPPPVTQKQDGILFLLAQILKDLLSVFLGLAEMTSILY